MKTDIIINETNRAKIEALLTEIQLKARTRTISAINIYDTCERIKRHVNVSMKALEGCRFDVDIHAFKKPRAYKYAPESTQFGLTVKSGKWRLTYVRRSETGSTDYPVECNFTNTCEDAIVNAYRKFII